MSYSRPAETQEDELRRLRAEYDRKRRARDYDEDMQYRGSGNIFNGSTKFINTMLTVIALLIVAGITGEVVVYGQVQAIARTVDLIVTGHIKP